MENEQKHKWGQTLLILAAIIFASGGYAMIVKDNTDEIKINRGDIKDNKDGIHSLELSDKELGGVINNINGALGRIEEEQKTQGDAIQNIEIETSKQTARVETLIGAD